MQVTVNQRKHYTQMTPSEVSAVKSFVTSVPYWDMSSRHLSDKLGQCALTQSDILYALRNGDVLECHANNAPDIRIVVRAIRGNRAVCVCVNTRGYVCTAWVNNCTDHHRTLKTHEYQWIVDLTNVFNRRIK
jgi:hypothetical protein